MTGFGRGVARGAVGEVTVELRAVNHRFLDVVPRLPREVLAWESQVVGAIKARLARGRVEAHVRVVPGSGAGGVQADAARYQALVATMASLSGLGADDPGLRRLALEQPGVLRVDDPTIDVEDAGWMQAVTTATAEALEALVAMRRREGEALRVVMLELVTSLAGQVEALAAHMPGLRARATERRASRLAELLDGAAVDPVRLAQEVALLVDKADIAEEIDRLASHLDQLREALSTQGAVGRRVEFLLQEAHREVNTIGSKAAEAVVQGHVVELKTLLERLREQAANVE